MKLRTILLFAVILLGCCLNPLENSLMPACKRVVMNSGKVQTTALPQMRSGKADNMVFRLLFQPVLQFFVPVEVFKTLNFLILQGGQ